MKKQHKKPKPYIVTKEACDGILATIGINRPEQGGFLGTSDGIHIDHFYYDHLANTTGSAYTPDTNAVNAALRHWCADGVKLIGNVHSHPDGCSKPSAGDIRYARHIAEGLEIDSFIVAIVLHAGTDDDLEIFFFNIFRDGTYEEFHPEYAVAYDPYNHDCDLELHRHHSEDKFARIKNFYPMNVLADKTIICVGTGGAIPFVEGMARSGVTSFVLFDPDIVAAPNIASSAFYVSEIGQSKVEVAKRRIQDINPDAHVIAIQRALDNRFTDEEFEEVIGQNLFLCPEDILICGCTDSFHAQARTANLAMKYGTPYLAAQLYAGGEAAEIYFSYPGVTNSSCPRCALNGRYEAYENGFKNDVTSEASPIFATDRLNSLKGQIALMLLLYHSDEHCRFSTMLDQAADRNFIQINMSPTAPEHLKLHIFEDAMSPELAFFDETVWIPQTPNNAENGFATCPLCGGTGDLFALKHTIQDSRRIFHD